jgi:hypothetical protein
MEAGSLEMTTAQLSSNMTDNSALHVPAGILVMTGIWFGAAAEYAWFTWQLG